MIHDLVIVRSNFSDEDYKNMVHDDFTHWIAQAEHKNAIEIFTTKYNLLKID